MLISEGQYFVYHDGIYCAVEDLELEDGETEGDFREVVQFEIYSTLPERQKVAKALKAKNVEDLDFGVFEPFEDGDEYDED